MTSRRGGLGRGLGALIPTASPPEAAQSLVAGESARAAIDEDAGQRDADRDHGARLIELAPSRISPNPRQPRQNFDADALAELVTSLREVGMLQPVVVRPDPAHPGRYELVMGERRWRAAQEAGLSVIPAIVRHTHDDDLLRDALLENLHRAELNPLEEAAAYQQLLQEFGATHDDLATRIGRSRSQVTNTIRLLGLPAAVQRRVAAGVLSAGHARALLGLPDLSTADHLAARIVAEGLSVRSVEELVSIAKAGEPAARAHRTRQRRREPVTDELTARVGEHLETRAHVEWGRAKSRLVIEIADAEDLARVVTIITRSAGSYTP